MEVVLAVVVGESPSLGRSISDLLTTSGVRTKLIRSVEVGGQIDPDAERGEVIVAASHGFYCSTLRLWLQGRLPHSRLIVVASRDPMLEGAGGVERIDLPLDAGRLVDTVRRLMSSEETPPTRAHNS